MHHHDSNMQGHTFVIRRPNANAQKTKRALHGHYTSLVAIWFHNKEVELN